MSQFTKGNQITLLRNGAEYFPALELAINAAKSEILLQVYIFELDDTGLRVGEALMQAAIRGVFVSLLLDGFGCRKFPQTYLKELKKAGIQVLFFRPKISPWTLKRNRLRRMHRKMTVIDGHVGFVGGINIIDDYNTPTHIPPRIDYAVRVEGALLPNMRDSMKSLWQVTCRTQLKRIRSSSLEKTPKKKAIGRMRSAFLLRDNFRHRSEIEDAYLLAIQKAKSEILIANAYFLPGLRFRNALRDAAVRGVRIILLLQKRTEYMLLDLATHGLYSEFLNQGVEIYEYHKSFMHSKVAVFDGDLAMVGSSNIDPFSLFLSLEANLIVDNPSFSEELRRDVQALIDSGSRLITANKWRRHHYVKRLVSKFAYALVRSIMSVIGYPEKN